MEVAEKTYNLKLIFRESKEFIDISPEKPKFFKSLPQKTSKLQKQTR